MRKRTAGTPTIVAGPYILVRESMYSIEKERQEEFFLATGRWGLMNDGFGQRNACFGTPQGVEDPFFEFLSPQDQSGTHWDLVR